MKKHVTLVLLLINVSFLSAQSLVVTGDTVIPTFDPCLLTQAHLDVENISPDTLDVLCEKFIIDTTAGTINYFCWGGNCYGEGIYISGSTNTLDPGEVDGIDFEGDYFANCLTSTAKIRYCFYPDNDPSDLSCITILYNGTFTSVIDKSTVAGIIEFFPNPASNFVFVEYNLNNVNKLSIVDILGNKIKEIDLEKNNIQRLFVGDLSSGIYFGQFQYNGDIVETKKLIVKR